VCYAWIDYNEGNNDLKRIREDKMEDTKRRFDPSVLALVNLLGIVSGFGFFYCLFALLSDYQAIVKMDAALYLVWFGISMLSVSVMRRGDKRGAYALGIATGAITLYDLARGMATLGGALLGILVLLIVYSYIKTTTPLDASDMQVTT
jgi:hypothetical protein